MARSTAPAVAVPDSPLSALVDIKEPAIIEPFYLTPLHILGIILLGLVVGFAAKAAYAYWQKNAPKRAAISALKALQTPTAAQINTILKRFVRSCAAAHPALTKSGSAWQDFLQSTVSNNPHRLPDLTVLMYQSTEDEQATSDFYAFAMYWLTRVKPGALYV